MMLPILMVVSVTPVSYFFCATADAVAAARISPESPRALISDPISDLTEALKKFVVKKSLAQRFMSFILRYGPGLKASCRRVSSSDFFWNVLERIAAGAEYRKRRQSADPRSSEANC